MNNPDIALIRTALKSFRQLASNQKHGGLMAEYLQAQAALDALGRLEAEEGEVVQLTMDEMLRPVVKAHRVGVEVSVMGFDDPVFFKNEHIDFEKTRRVARGQQ